MTRALKVLLLAACCCGVLTATPSRSQAAEAVLYAAGDIACDPLAATFNAGAGRATSCRQQATADLMVDGTFNAVLALGDVQYETATLSEFAQSYNPSWGRVKPLTLPVIGNHEALTSGAAGYCAYFGAAAHCNASGSEDGAAFYSLNLGDWHIVVVNSNCKAAGGCGRGSPQYEWLQADLDANPRSCTLAAWHHPRWSSGYDGNNDFMQPLWQLLYAEGADVVLAGHSHHYERFAPIDGNGAVNPSNGMRSFVVGTGGANFTPINSVAKGSEVRQNTSFGLLRLALHPTSYDWNFVPVAGSTFTDSGSQSCRGLSPSSKPTPSASAPGAPAAAPAVRRAGALLALWRVNSARARLVLRRGHIHIPARRWAPTVVRVHVAGRLAARRFVRDRRPFMVQLASWSKDRRYRHGRVTVTIRRPS